LLVILHSKKAIIVFSALNPEIAVGIIAASSTIFVSVITVVLSKRQEQKALISSHIREKKIPIYEKIIDFIFRITFQNKSDDPPPTEKEIIQFFAEATKDLVIWGSQEALEAFGKFKEDLGSGDGKLLLTGVEDFLISLRKDLGHDVRKFKRGDILKTYINDYSEFFK